MPAPLHDAQLLSHRVQVFDPSAYCTEVHEVTQYLMLFSTEMNSLLGQEDRQKFVVFCRNSATAAHVRQSSLEGPLHVAHEVSHS